jgi:O-antigen/teichoic acid export membrane protein
MPFVVHKLGDERYGIWVILISLTGHLGLFNFGIRNSVVKFVSQYRTGTDLADLNRVINTSLSIYFVLAILAFTTSIVLSFFIGDIFQVRPHHLRTMQWAIILTGLNVSIGFFAGVFAGVLSGSQRYDILNVLTIFNDLLRACLTVLVLSLDRGIISLAMIALLNTFLQLIGNYYFSKRQNPTIHLSLAYFSRERLREMFGYGFYMFLMGIAVKLLYYTDNIVIGVFLPLSHVTHYAIGVRLISLFRTMIKNVTNVLLPATSEMAANNECDRVQRLYILSTKYVNYIIFPVSLGFILYN